MKQGLIEKISKNKELPKTMSEVYRSLGLKNYRFDQEFIVLKKFNSRFGFESF